MPELPEVETTRRGIVPWVEGRQVTGLTVRNGRLRQPVPDGLAAEVCDATVLQVRRRAKYLLLDFTHGGLVVHLGMSGSLRVVERGSTPQTHDHIDLEFGDTILRYRDPRRFGLFLWQTGDALTHPLLQHLGPEPLSEAFDAAYLHAATRGARQPIKQFIMDAHRVVGVGNIYASESLFRARIHPLKAAGELGKVRLTRLVAAIKETLEAAILAGGSTLRDFVGGDGKPGYFQQQYFVYGRHGEPCRICATPVQRAVMGQRATYWCPKCQSF